MEVEGLPDPSLALKVTVTLAAVHFANKVRPALSVYEAPAATSVPSPSACVFHPAKLKPVLARLPVLEARPEYVQGV